jgi:arylformamidase
MRTIDISVDLQPRTAVWPGDRKVTITRQKDMARGDDYNLSCIGMSLHAGTHIDAPRHLLRAGRTMDDLPLDAVIGRARVISIVGRTVIEPADLARHGIRRGERLLIRTANSSRRPTGPFVKDFVHLSEAAAAYLAARKLRCLGVDGASPGAYAAPAGVHRILMEAGIWIIENLDLSKAAPGRYELLCLPLKVAGAEGAPARAVLRTGRRAK